jgi:uncharacterized membrane protein
MKKNDAKPGIHPFSPVSSDINLSLGVLVILCAALMLRLWGLREKSLWLDESLGLFFAASRARDFFPLLSLDVHPPLYFMLLRILFFLSKSPVFWRIFSVVCGTASLAVFHLSLKSRAHKGALLLSLILLTISPVMVHYSQEIRMYALLVLLTSLAFWSCLLFIEKPELSGFALFCLFSVLSIYTHYFAGVFIIGCLVFLAWERGRFHENLFMGAWDAFRTAILIAVLYLPWMHVFFRHLYSSSLGGKHAQSHFSGLLQTMTEYFTQFFGGVIPWAPLEKTILFNSNPWHLGSLGWILFFLFIMILFGYGLNILRKETRLFRALTSILAVGAIVTFIHLTLKGRFYPRCFIIYLPLVFYILARGMIAIPMRFVRLACMVYLSLCLLIPALLYLSIDIRDVSLPLSRILKEETSPDDIILHTNKFSYFPMKIYLPDKRQFLADTPSLLLQERTLAKADLIDNARGLSSARRIWLVVEYWGAPAPSDDPDFWLNDWLGSSWTFGKPLFLSMGVKKCTVIKCDRKN